MSINKSYSSNDADVHLISSDNIIFKVHSFNLKAFSSVFREMLSADSGGLGAPSPDPTSPNSQIPIDAQSTDIEIWLDFMYKLDVPTTTWQRYHRILKLSELFGTEIIGERVVYRLEAVASSAPWDIFCVASKYNLLPLARTCIKVFGTDPNVGKLQTGLLSLQMAEKCSLSYLLGIVKLMGKKERTLDSHGRSAGVVTWESMANEFQPVMA